MATRRGTRVRPRVYSSVDGKLCEHYERRRKFSKTPPWCRAWSDAGADARCRCQQCPLCETRFSPEQDSLVPGLSPRQTGREWLLASGESTTFPAVQQLGTALHGIMPTGEGYDYAANGRWVGPHCLTCDVRMKPMRWAPYVHTLMLVQDLADSRVEQSSDEFAERTVRIMALAGHPNASRVPESESTR